MATIISSTCQNNTVPGSWHDASCCTTPNDLLLLHFTQSKPSLHAAVCVCVQRLVCLDCLLILLPLVHLLLGDGKDQQIARTLQAQYKQQAISAQKGDAFCQAQKVVCDHLQGLQG